MFEKIKLIVLFVAVILVAYLLFITVTTIDHVHIVVVTVIATQEVSPVEATIQSAIDSYQFLFPGTPVPFHEVP